MSGWSSTYPLVGFYADGERSPVSAGGCAPHHQRMTIMVINERFV
jgi:hypothetical protein